MAPFPTPTASIERQRIVRSGQADCFRDDRSRRSELALRAIALLLAHGLATLTLLLGVTVWSDWRAADHSINPWLILALLLLLCLNPFAALAISAMLASPAEALSIARSLTARPLASGHRTAILLFTLGFASAALLASFALTLLVRFT